MALNSLKAHLKLLQQENKQLMKDLAKKKKEAAERKRTYLIHRKESLEHFDNISARLEDSQKHVRLQKSVLQDATAEFQSNEDRLESVARRLARLEEAQDAGMFDRDRMKAELLALLGDVKKIRTRREKILGSVGRENAAST